MIGFANNTTWSWLQLSFDSVEDTLEYLVVSVTVCLCCVSVCVCVLALCQPALFLIGTEMLDKNNVTWCVLGCVPQTGMRQRTTNTVNSGFILTSRVRLNLSSCNVLSGPLRCPGGNTIQSYLFKSQIKIKDQEAFRTNIISKNLYSVSLSVFPAVTLHTLYTVELHSNPFECLKKTLITL